MCSQSSCQTSVKNTISACLVLFVLQNVEFIFHPPMRSQLWDLILMCWLWKITPPATGLACVLRLFFCGYVWARIVSETLTRIFSVSWWNDPSVNVASVQMRLCIICRKYSIPELFIWESKEESLTCTICYCFLRISKIVREDRHTFWASFGPPMMGNRRGHNLWAVDRHRTTRLHACMCICEHRAYRSMRGRCHNQSSFLLWIFIENFTLSISHLFCWSTGYNPLTTHIMRWFRQDVFLSGGKIGSFIIWAIFLL